MGVGDGITVSVGRTVGVGTTVGVADTWPVGDKTANGVLGVGIAGLVGVEQAMALEMTRSNAIRCEAARKYRNPSHQTLSRRAYSAQPISEVSASYRIE
jgi:hypothetical protein